MNRFALLTISAALVALPAAAFAQTPAPSGAMHDAMKHDAMAHTAMSHSMTHGAMAHPKKGDAMAHSAMSHDAMSHSMTHESPKP
jgi:pentapeptide MXKDX repeat protein